MRVSVVITTHNRADLLARGIESVLAQTRQAGEILVVDDGSTDDTPAVIARYPEVRCVRKENGGLSSARNVGVREASCEWVAPLDDDDVYSPRMLERLQQAFDAAPQVDVLYTATQKVTLEGTRLGQSHQGHRTPANPLAGMALENFVLSSAVCARRDVLLRAGLYDPEVGLAVDHDLWIRVAALGGRFTFVDEPLASITKQQRSMSSSSLRMATATLQVLERRSELLDALAVDGRKWWLGAAHYRVGRVHWENGDYAAAEESFNLALRHDPRHFASRLYRWMGRRSQWLGPFLHAREWKRSAMRTLRGAGLVEDRWG